MTKRKAVVAAAIGKKKALAANLVIKKKQKNPVGFPTGFFYENMDLRRLELLTPTLPVLYSTN
jgi:hypothetical protein